MNTHHRYPDLVPELVEGLPSKARNITVAGQWLIYTAFPYGVEDDYQCTPPL